MRVLSVIRFIVRQPVRADIPTALRFPMGRFHATSFPGWWAVCECAGGVVMCRVTGRGPVALPQDKVNLMQRLVTSIQICGFMS